MGFETLRINLTKKIPKYYEISLWDLKLVKTCSIIAITGDYEISLWDLKRFSNLSARPPALNYEISLWDLKLLWWSLLLRLFRHYEISLWDLKLSKRIIIKYNRILWDIPMGFETRGYRHYNIFGYIMRYPYGIWNVATPDPLVEFQNYEISLWDLKPFLNSAGEQKTLLWDIPMGFETVDTLNHI